MARVLQALSAVIPPIVSVLSLFFFSRIESIGVGADCCCCSSIGGSRDGVGSGSCDRDDTGVGVTGDSTVDVFFFLPHKIPVISAENGYFIGGKGEETDQNSYR